MKLTLLFLFSTAVFVPAQIAQVQVRVVTFADAGIDTALLAARPGCDSELFAALNQNVAAGEATIDYDQIQLVRGGQRAKVVAVRQIPYATGHKVDNVSGLTIPGALYWQVDGPQLEVEATVGVAGSLSFPGRPIDLNVHAENQTMLSMLNCPAADLRDQGRMGSVRMPLAADHKSTAQALTATGSTMLLSIAGEPQSSKVAASEARFFYTFLRAGVTGESPDKTMPGAPACPFQRRLHAITLRLSTDAAAALMQSSHGDDATLFAALSAKTANGEANLSGHAAILGRNGQRSKVESTLQYPYPTGYADLFPAAWTFQSLGTMLEADAGGGFMEKDQPLPGDWNVALELSGAPEPANFHPDRNRPELHISAAAHTSRRFVGNITIPASGVFCAGVFSSVPATQRDDATEGMTDFLFFLQSPLPTMYGKQTKPQQRVAAMMLSVPERRARGLAAGSDSSGLLSQLGTADVRCAGIAAVTTEDDRQNEVQWVRQVPQPSGFSKATVSPDLEIPSSWQHTACGLKLKAAFSTKSGATMLNATLSWDSAPVAPFGAPGAKLPEMSERRCEEQIELTGFPPTRGKAIIADVRASKARKGTPEHGRWHVLVVRTTP